MGVEIIVIVVVALAAGAAIAYFFFRRDDDDKRTDVQTSPSYIGAESIWQNGGDGVLTYDDKNDILSITSKSPPTANNLAQSWIISEEAFLGNAWQVIYNIRGTNKYYLARNAGGHPSVVRNVPDASCAWSVIGPSTGAIPMFMFTDPTIDPFNPQLITLSCEAAGRSISLLPFGPGLSDFVWRTIPFP